MWTVNKTGMNKCGFDLEWMVQLSLIEMGHLSITLFKVFISTSY